MSKKEDGLRALHHAKESEQETSLPRKGPLYADKVTRKLSINSCACGFLLRGAIELSLV